MCVSRRKTKWILGNVQNNYRNMTEYVNRQVESSTPSDQQQRRPDSQKFDDDVAQTEGDGWLSEDAVDCQCLRMIYAWTEGVGQEERWTDSWKRGIRKLWCCVVSKLVTTNNWFRMKSFGAVVIATIRAAAAAAATAPLAGQRGSVSTAQMLGAARRHDNDAWIARHLPDVIISIFSSNSPHTTTD